MAVLTNFLKLLKPEKNDYVDVDKHISENYDKIDNKMQELNTSNSGKLDKGALPTTIKSGKDLYDMLENNGGINIDTALLYLNDAGTKTAGKVYFDKNKKGLFECIKTTTNTVNSTEFFVDISNKASSDRLTNLVEINGINKLSIRIGTAVPSSPYDKYTDVILSAPFENKCLFAIGLDDVIYTDNIPLSKVGIDTSYMYKDKIRFIHDQSIFNFLYCAIGY